MRLISGCDFEFRDDTVVAGTYMMNDPFKPFVHDLRTPRGRLISATSPQDHVHHKGMMYALKSSELNWWEEVPSEKNGAIGRQRILATEAGEAGFSQSLQWEPCEGGDAHWLESRTITCERIDDAFVWTWRSRLTAQRGITLIQSPWSHKLEDGRRVNYHGLGFRFARDIGSGAGQRHLEADGVQLGKVMDGMGLSPRRVTYVGRLDPVYPSWPGPRVAVTIEQRHAPLGLYACDGGFGFMSMGPSNLAERAVRAGESLEHDYVITVADLD